MLQRLIIFFIGSIFAFSILELSLRAIPDSYYTRKLVNLIPGKPLILCVNDSFTYGAGVEKGEDYPSYLKKLLKNRFNVINHGKSGSNSSIVRNILFNDLNNFRPAWVIIQVGWSNSWNLNGYYSPKNSPPYNPNTFHLRIVQLIRLIIRRFHPKNRFHENPDLHPDGSNLLKSVNPFKPKADKVYNSIDFSNYKGKNWDLFHAGRYEDLIKNLSHENWKRDYSSALIYTLSLLEKDDAKTALAVVDYSINSWKDKSVFWAGKGYILKELSQKNEALKTLLTGAKLFPNDTAYYCLIGELYSSTNNYKLATKWWEKGLSLMPDNVNILENLGEYYLASNDFSKSYSFYKRAIANSKDNPEDFYNLGIACFKLGKTNEALKYLDLAGKNQKDADIAQKAKYYRARLLLDTGSTEEAKQSFKELGNRSALDFIDSTGSNKKKILTWYENDLRLMIEYCIKNKINVALMNYPEIRFDWIRKIDKTMKTISSEYNIPYIDNLKYFKKLLISNEAHKKYIQNDGHCTKYGNEEVAKNIVKKLRL